MKPEKPAAESPDDNGNPYPGLRPYQEHQKDRFFGRDQEIHILTDKILANRLTLLVAASGVGKSSLLQAGVMPALRTGSIMVDLIYHNDWTVNPSRDLKENIVKHYIRQQRINPDYNADLEQPLDQFLRVHSLLGNGTLVLLLDQFEEFFYYQRFSKLRLQFIQELAAAIRDTQSSTAFVFSMREDFAMEMEAFKTWLPGIFDNIYRIEKLSLEAARQAIISPVAALGFKYQPELIEQLLTDLGQRERQERLDLKQTEQQQEAPLLVEPPHLQIVCQELWLHGNTAQDRIITTTHYNDLGRANGILDRYFKSKMARLNGQQQRLASRAFDHLVSQHGAKMSYPLEELAILLAADQAALQQTLDLLQSAAILRRLQRQGRPWYELYHDIFAKSIVAWNQEYKNRQMRKRFALWAASIVVAGSGLFAGYDFWENYSHRHLRLGKQTVSERVEVYQGEIGSRDIFKRQGFLFETDYQWQAIEADKRFETDAIPELNQDRQMQIGQIPLEDRFIEYANAGLLDKADKVAVVMRDDELIKSLFQGLPEIRMQQSVNLLDKLYQENPKRAAGIAEVLTSINAQSTISLFIKLLDDSDQEVRKTAAYVLGNLKAEAAVPGLLPLLKDNDAYLRSSAADALGKLKAEAAVPELLPLLKDDNADVRSRAAEALGELKAEAAVPGLIQLLEDSNEYVRKNAAEVLAELKAEAAVPALMQLLKDDNADVRSSAAQILGELKAEAAVPGLMQLLKDNDAAVLLYAVNALGNIKAEAAVPGLLPLLKDSYAGIRSSAADALGKLKAEAVVPGLLPLLKDSDRDVRSSAADALGNLKAEAAVPGLLPLLKDNDVTVRSSAAVALGKLKPEAVVPGLVQLLKDDNAYVRSNAADALGKLKAEAVVPGLVPLLKDDNADVRSSEAVALGELKAETAVPGLLPLLKDSDAGVRRRAADALGKLKAEAAVPGLLPLLKDNDEYVRSSAADALGKLKAEAVVPGLLPLLKDSDAGVRRRAADALGKLKAEAAVPGLLPLLKDNDKYVRRSAAVALSELKVEAAVPGMLPLLKDNDEYVRSSAAKALGKLKAETAVPGLVQLLKDSDRDVRSSAADALGKLKAEAVVPGLLPLLKDSDRDVRSSAADALGNLKAEAAVPGLLPLLKDNEAYVRNSAADALGNLKAEAAVPGLLPLLKDEAYVRSSAVVALGNIKAEAAIAEMLQLLKDNDAYVRSSAAVALGIMKAKTAIPRLIKLLETDANSGMQQAAAVALSRMNAKTPVLTQWQDKQLTELAKKINTGSTEERAKSVITLGAIHNEAAVTLLLGLLKDKDTDVVKNAIESLGNIGEYHPEWLQPYAQQLLLFTADPDTDIQATAISAMGQLIAFNGKTKATTFVEFEQTIIERLIAIAKDSKQKNLRFTALDALGSSANPQAAAALLSLLQEEELAGLHFSITYWLGHIAYKPAQPLLQARLKELEQDKQQWRTQRDAKPSDTESQQATSTQAKEDKSWQYEVRSYQIAYAIARISPETDGITLLEHPLYAVRQAAIQALAEKADGKLIQKLLEYHQAFDPAYLPSPRPYDAYRALDKALFKVEVSGNQNDLELLKKLKGKQITTTMKTQERAINERFDWTIAELGHRLKTANTP